MKELKPGVGPRVKIDRSDDEYADAQWVEGDGELEPVWEPDRRRGLKVVAAIIVIIVALAIAVAVFELNEFGDGGLAEDFGAYPEDGVAGDPGPGPGDLEENGSSGGSVSASFAVDCDGFVCAFDASGSDAGEDVVLEYSWDFGDGSTGEGMRIDHTYGGPGAYSVVLTVRDTDGTEDATTRVVEVGGDPPDDLKFSGEGDGITESFTTQQMLLEVAMEHDGDGSFIVRLVRPDGSQAAVFADTAGDYDGSRYFDVPPGTYHLVVTADDDWEVIIQQPRYDGGSVPPFGWSGDGDTASDAMELVPRTYTLEWTHEGPGAFEVWMFTSAGDRVALVAEGFGASSGSSTLQVQSGGTYVLDIVADGDWTLSVE